MLVPFVNATPEGVERDGTSSHKVVFINPGFSDQGFWFDVTETMSAAASQLGFELEVYYSDRQWIKMVRNAEAVINGSDKPDFLILVNEYQEGARLLAMANKAGIPTLMLLNSLTPEQHSIYDASGDPLENWIASITPDNEVAGYEMAKSLLPVTQPSQEGDLTPIPLLTLAGDNNTPASQSRLEGLDRALNEFPQLKEQRRISVNWSEDEAYKRTRLWLASGEHLGAVWAANDAIALGAIKAIREVGLKPGKDVKIAGVNWTEEGIQYVMNGEMTLTHGGHFLAGAWSMVMLYDIVQDGGFSSRAEVHFPMTAINKTNAAEYVKHFSSREWTRIDFKSFSLTHKKNATGYQFTLDKLIQSIKQPLRP
ncbi:MAG: ABC transporter substrate-binding protein [Oleispira sp.]|nr:ABC transporter substrate-binding protein [Oleispira sp.]MBL4881135.1 ABC transporter substrate-binding protein [Oleispira sp.]